MGRENEETQYPMSLQAKLKARIVQDKLDQEEAVGQRRRALEADYDSDLKSVVHFVNKCFRSFADKATNEARSPSIWRPYGIHNIFCRVNPGEVPSVLFLRVDKYTSKPDDAYIASIEDTMKTAKILLQQSFRDFPVAIDEPRVRVEMVQTHGRKTHRYCQVQASFALQPVLE